jgi:iron complex outermembrane recepter protein
MKAMFRSASGVALIVGLAGSLQSAFGQQVATPDPAGPQNQTVTTSAQTPQSATTDGVDQATPGETPATRDRVVVTGSLTGSREAGELPVEVYTNEDMKKSGSPNVQEFIQSLSVVGESVTNIDPTLSSNGGIFTDLYGAGFANFNLRGLSDSDSERTLNLVNGRRTSSNANLLPMQAMQQVEILKDGASATYGAGAVGGVVNFITRRDFEGVILEGETKFIEGIEDYSQYEMKYTQGWASDVANLLVSLSYNHQGEINGGDLDWTRNPYEVNPAQWAGATANNPTTYYPNGPLTTGGLSAIRMTNGGGAATNYPAGSAIVDFTTDVCAALGGVNPRTSAVGHLQDVDTDPAAPAFTVGPPFAFIDHNDTRGGGICFFDAAPFQMVQQETNRIGAFGQFTADLDDTMQFNMTVNYTKTDAPNVKGLPSQSPLGTRAPYGTNGNPNGVAGGIGFPASNPMNPTLANPYNHYMGGVGCSTASCSYAIPTNHPAVQDFLNRANVGRNVNGVPQVLTANLPAAGTSPQANNLIWAGFWRPFSYGGLPNGSPWVEGYRKEDFYEGTINLKGTFSEGGFFGLGRFLPENTSYDFAVTASDSEILTAQPDIVSYRLQEALNGFGGPNCQAPDLVPHADPTMPRRENFPAGAAGTTAFNNAVAAAVTAFNATIGTQNPAAAGKNGCLYFNPFVSAIAGNAATGAANPAYNPALANDPVLADWLFTDAAAQTRNRALTFDVLFTGEVPGFELPGGAIGWGVGGQWRQTEYENRVIDPLYDPYRYDCPWSPWIPRGQIQQAPGDIGCFVSSTGQGGGTLMTKQGGGRLNTNSDRQTTAAIFEVSAPVLDNWSMTLTNRYEEVSGSIGDWVHQFSTKYDVTDSFSVRGSWSTNFTSPDPNVLDNDGITVAGPVGGLTGVPVVPITTIVDPTLGVETAEQFNIGFIFDQDDFLVGDSNLRVSIDYYNIWDEGEVTSLSGSTIVTRAFPTPSNVTTGNAIVNTGQPRVPVSCDGVLMTLITLAEPCVPAIIVNRVVQNPDTATDINDIIAANTLILNGPALKNAGVDFSIDYRFPAFGGQLAFGGNATRILEYKAKAAFYNGERIPLTANGGAFGFSDDYLGWANAGTGFGTGKNGSRWRASVYANYSRDNHNLRWTTRLISAVDDERNPQNIAGVDPATGLASTTGFGESFFGMDGEDHYVSDFNWTWDMPWSEDFQFRLSVLNVFDKDPAPFRGATNLTGGNTLPYNSYIYSPYGRQWEIGFSKTF